MYAFFGCACLCMFTHGGPLAVCEMNCFRRVIFPFGMRADLRLSDGKFPGSWLGVVHGFMGVVHCNWVYLDSRAGSRDC